MSNRETINILNNLEKSLKNRIVGQDEALAEIIHTFNHGELSLSREERPKGVLLFLGPTGTGKTETALALADVIFNEKEKLQRFDMSAYMQEAQIMTHFMQDMKEAIEKHGEKGCIILLDEIEKANRRICYLCLQMFDAARIRIDGKDYNLSNYYFIVTSNIGSKKIAYGNFTNRNELQEAIEAELIHQDFPPEFVGRFDEKLCFNYLNYDAQKLIAQLKVKSEVKRLKEVKDIDLEYDNTFVNFCIRYGIKSDLGARPLRNFIERKLQEAVTQLILTDRMAQKAQIKIDQESNSVVIIPLTPSLP